jgi:hypothetical protein
MNNFPVLMTAPGRSASSQSGLIEFGKSVETLPDGRFVEAKVPKEPRKKKGALPEVPQPFVGPPPVISGAGKPRGAKERSGPEKPLEVFQSTAMAPEPTATAAVGEAVSGVKKSRASRFAKGSQEAKDFMASLREKAKAKKASAPASAKVEKAVKAAVDAVAPKPVAPAAAKSKKSRMSEKAALLARLAEIESD